MVVEAKVPSPKFFQVQVSSEHFYPLFVLFLCPCSSLVCVCVVLCFYVCICMLFGPYNFAYLFFFPIYKGGNTMFEVEAPLFKLFRARTSSEHLLFVFFLGSHFSHVCLVFLCMPSCAFWVLKFCCIFFYLQGWEYNNNNSNNKIFNSTFNNYNINILVATITTPIKLATPIVVATTPITIPTLTTILLVAITISIAAVVTTIIITILVLQHQF